MVLLHILENPLNISLTWVERVEILFRFFSTTVANTPSLDQGSSQSVVGVPDTGIIDCSTVSAATGSSGFQRHWAVDELDNGSELMSYDLTPSRGTEAGGYAQQFLATISGVDGGEKWGTQKTVTRKSRPYQDRKSSARSN